VAEEEAEASEEGEVEAEGIEEEKAEEEEEKEEKKKKREEIPEEEIVEERIYTIPLSRAWIAPRKKRAPRAMRMVKAFIEKHMKIETGTKTEEEEEEEGRLVVSEEVNRKLWSRGIEKPPRNIRVRAVKDKEGTVTLYLAEGD
jgi:large subunit ribosomal protein L31e